MFSVGSVPDAYLLLRLLNLKTGGELREVLINRSDDSGDRRSPSNGTWTRVGDIHTNQHGWLTGILQPTDRRGRPRSIGQPVIDTTHLHVDLQCDVPEVLELTLLLPELGYLDTDTGDLEIYIQKVFDAVVHVFVAIRENNQDHGRLLRVLLSHGSPDCSNSIFADWVLSNFPGEAHGSVERVALNPHTGGPAHVRQSFDCPFEFRVTDTLELVPISIADEENSPFRQPATNSELDSPEVPACLVVNVRFTLAIVDSGGGQKTSRNNSHLLTDADAEGVKGTSALFESKTLQTLVHDKTSVDVRRLRGDLDHFGSMFVGELATIRLIWKYLADLRREEVRLVASNIHKQQIGVRKGDVVLWSASLASYSAGFRGNEHTLFEVLLNSDRAKITAIKLMLTSSEPGQFLNGFLVA